ncbi:RNA-binding S4 domain-containing protein [Vibrio paucivorans]
MNQEEYEEQQYDGEEIEIEAIGIEVSSQPIELYKVFKIANLVGGGGEAKHIISEGYVAVNGELETRKRRKMYDGDFFEFNQEYYVVVCDAPVTEEPELTQPLPEPKKKAPKGKDNKPSAKSSSKKSGQGSTKKTNKKKESASKPTRDKDSGRNSIDFF